MKRALGALAVLLAAACAHVELQPPQTTEFELLGRLAARYAQDAFTGNLIWRHAAAGDELERFFLILVGDDGRDGAENLAVMHGAGCRILCAK